MEWQRSREAFFYERYIGKHVRLLLGRVWRTVAPYESIQRTRNRPRPGTGAPATRMSPLKQTAITIGISGSLRATVKREVLAIL